MKIGNRGALSVENAISPSLENAKDRRRVASQSNAARSTGPKTVAGKARVSKNAMKHGMRSETGTLPDQLVPMLRATTARWFDELRPEGQAEIALVKQASFSTVCMDWLSDRHVATLSNQVRRTGQLWDSRQARAAGEEAELLEADPAAAISLLRNSAAGCDRLLDRWNELPAPLEHGGTWSDDDRKLLVRLLGHTPEDMDDNVLSIQLLSCDLASKPIAADVDRDSKARTALLAFTSEKMADLSSLRDQLWVEVDGDMRLEAEQIALLPQGKSAGLFLRYQGMHSGGLHRALNLLIKIRTLDASPRTNNFRGLPNLDAALDPPKPGNLVYDCLNHSNDVLPVGGQVVEDRGTDTAANGSGRETLAPNEARTQAATTTCAQPAAFVPVRPGTVRNGDRDEIKTIPTRQVQAGSRWAEHVKRSAGIVCVIILAIVSLGVERACAGTFRGRVETPMDAVRGTRAAVRNAAPNEARNVVEIKTCAAAQSSFPGRSQQIERP